MSRIGMFLTLTIAFAALFGCESSRTTSISKETQSHLDSIRTQVLDQKAILLDVRSPQEWNQGHLAEATHFSISEIERIAQLPKEEQEKTFSRVISNDKPIFTHCQAGGRAKKAAEILERFGYKAEALPLSYEDLAQQGFTRSK